MLFSKGPEEVNLGKKEVDSEAMKDVAWGYFEAVYPGKNFKWT